MEMLTQDYILKVCDDRVKGQKPVLLFLCCIPICAFIGFVFKSLVVMLIATVILAIVIIVRQMMAKKEYNLIKNDQFQAYYDRVVELPSHRNTRRGARTCEIITENLYKTSYEILPSIYDSLEVGDQVVLIIGDGKLIDAYSLRNFQVGIDIENKIKNCEK